MDGTTRNLIKDFLIVEINDKGLVSRRRSPSIYVVYEVKRDDIQDATKVLSIVARVDLATPRQESAGHGDIPLPHFQTEQFLDPLKRAVVNKKASSIAFQLLDDDVTSIIAATKDKKIDADIWQAAGYMLKGNFFRNLTLVAGVKVPILGLDAYPSVPDNASANDQTAFEQKEKEWWAIVDKISCTPKELEPASKTEKKTKN